MRYFGVPICPYCKKRVNLIRTWSLKRQGEYQCPRCGGISNIFLSPLIYVLAMLAIFAGGAMYFFHKFVLDDITIDTAIYVFIPFAAFFLFSLFMVYLEKPVIKKVSKEEYEKKRRIRSAVNGSAGAVSNPDARRGCREEDDFVPRSSHRPGPEASAAEQRRGVVNQAAFSRAKLQAAVENTQQSQRPISPRPSARPQQQRPTRPAQPANQAPQQRIQAGRIQQQAAPRTAQRRVQQGAAHNQQQVRQSPVSGQTQQPHRVGPGATAHGVAYTGGRQIQGYPQHRPQGQNHTTNGGQ